MFCLCGFLPFLSLKTDENQNKNKLRCTAVPEPCVQLCIRRTFRSFFWSLNIFTSKHLYLNHPPFRTTGCSDELERHWKWKFLKMGRQFLVGLDRPVKEDHFDLKISTWAKREESMFWSFHALADKTNNGPFPKPFFRVIRRSNGLICKRKYAFWLLIFAKSVLKPLNYLIAAAAPINTNGLLLYYKTQE